MQMRKEEKECAICGKKEEYYKVISNFVHGSADFDLKENGSMASPGSEIQECPHCHYCNFDISKAVQSRFEYNEDKLEIWNNYDDVQKIIKNETGALRKYLVMAEQYKGNLNHEGRYNMLLRASWCCGDEEKANEYRNEAVMCYVDNIMPGVQTKLVQLADIARMLGWFDVASDFVKAGSLLINEDESSAKFLKKVVKYEKNFIKNEDTARHNLSEIK